MSMSRSARCSGHCGLLVSEVATWNLHGQGFWVSFNGPSYELCEGPVGYDCQVNIVDLEDLQVGDGVGSHSLNNRRVSNMVTIGASGATVSRYAGGESWESGRATGGVSVVRVDVDDAGCGQDCTSCNGGGAAALADNEPRHDEHNDWLDP